MTRIESIIALLKANTGAATVAPSLIASYANLAETTTLETISSTIMAGSILKPGFEIAPAADVIEQMFISLFGYSQTEMDAIRATEAGAAGFQYWVDELNNNVDIINVNTLAIALLNGAAPADQAKAAALVADELAAYEEYAGETVEEPEVEGQTYELTSGTDKGAAFVGTDKNDFYDASIAQNSFTGGVSNTLSSADKLDGGAGTDTLHAEIVAEFVGATTDYQIDIQPQTKDIEIVTFEARDNGSNDQNNTLVTVDAKKMTGLDKIGSKNSDGDLVIENLTTLTDGGAIRHTSEMTITMDHTDNFNSDGDASDLTVYFDEDYLNTTTKPGGSSLTINMINTLNLELNDGSSLIQGFETVTFTVDDTPITVDVAGAELDEVQGLIQDALADAGFNDITVDTYTEEAYFGTNIYHAGSDVTYPAGEYAGTYTAFRLTADNEVLAEGGYNITDGQNDGSLAYSQDDRLNNDVNLPISINVELEKVGRDGDGGNLIIGGKDQDSIDQDVDQNDGIEQFDITVLGGEAKPSNLGFITSTNGFLETVNISSDNLDEEGYAALTVRGIAAVDVADVVSPFGGTLTNLNANAFLGDLYIGVEEAAQNIDTFTATGGGDVTLVEVIDGTENGVDYTVTTGNGSDTLDITLDGDAVDTIGESFALNAGNGDNTVTVDMQGAKVSVATTADLDNLSITTGSGEDKVTLIGGNTNNGTTDGDADFNISTGDSSDFVYINSIDDTDSAGALKGEWTVGTNTGASAQTVLYKAELTVDFAGFEQTVTINTTAANNFIATQVDINNAIIAAIKANPELERLLTTELGTGTQELTINSLVEGQNELSISINQKDLVDMATPAGNVTDTEVRIASTADLDALEKGLVETGSTSTNVDTEAELITEFNATADIPGTVNDPAYVLTTSNGGSADETTVTNVSTIDLGDGSNDLVVLNSHAASEQTIVFSADWGKVSVVNFETNGEAGENNDGTAPDDADTNNNVLDFSAWLDDEVTPSGSTLSAERVDETVAIATEFGQNTVVVTDLTTLDTAFDTTGGLQLSFDTLTNNQVLAALNGNGTTGTAATYAAVADSSHTYSTIGTDARDSILLIENSDNLGEYKAYNVTYTDAGGDDAFTKATLIGTIDFGNSVDLVDANVDTIA